MEETAAKRARDRFGGEVMAGGKPFLVKSKIMVARYRKCVIAKLAIARFSERATATSSSFFPFSFIFLYIIFFSFLLFLFLSFSFTFHFIFFSLAVAPFTVNALLQ